MTSTITTKNPICLLRFFPLVIACTDALHMSVSPCMRRWCQHAMPTSPSSLTGSLAISTFRLSISEYRPTCLLTHTSLIQSQTTMSLTHLTHLTHMSLAHTLYITHLIPLAYHAPSHLPHISLTPFHTIHYHPKPSSYYLPSSQCESIFSHTLTNARIMSFS